MKRILLIHCFLISQLIASAQWQSTNGPISPVVRLLQTDEYLFAGCSSASTSNGVYRTSNDGDSWTSIISGSVSGSISGLAESNGNLFASQANQVFVSTNNGMNWALVTNGLPSGFVRCLSSFENTVYAGGTGISFTTNNGLNWSQLATTWNSATTAIYIDVNIFLAGTLDGKVYKSLDNGNSWTQISTGLIGNSVASIIVSGDTYLTGTSEGIFKTSNAGINWTETSSSATFISDLININGYFFASSSSNGVLVSINNGDTWLTLNDGLVSNQVNCLANNTEYIFAGVSSSAVHRRSISEIINQDTCYFSITDTSFVTISDTTFTNIFDTTFVEINDTIYTELIDTSYFSVFDTTTVVVFDTTFVTINDTSYIDITDTTFVSIFDTTYIELTDTTFISVFDTTYIDIVDTSYVIVNDTIYTELFDTTFISVTDTLIINTIITSQPDLIVNTIRVYPNPAGSVITIDFGAYDLINGYSLEIANNLGQTVFQENINQQQAILNTSELGNPGTYFLRIYNTNNSLIQSRIILIQ